MIAQVRNQNQGARWDGDYWGRFWFRVVLILVPAVTLGATVYIMLCFPYPKSGAPVSSVAPQTALSATTPITPTVGLGAFDQALGDGRRFAVGVLVLLVGAIIETVLLLAYGAFYVNDPQNKSNPLGLPTTTVRVFLLVFIILALLIFALLPEAWGENKAVTFLLGSVSTIVGFYFGSRGSAQSDTSTTAETATPGTATPGTAGVPSGWSCADIGVTGPAGSTTLSNGTWTVKGSGNDVWGNTDEFHYDWQSVTGNFSVSALVTGQTPTDEWAKAGLMLRASTDRGAPFYDVVVTPGHGISVQYRRAQGEPAQEKVRPGGNVPVFLQAKWSATTCDAYSSLDGKTWTLIPGSGVSLDVPTGPMLAGLVVCSHAKPVPSIATFSDVQVSTGS